MSDASNRILAGLLESRTGQHLSINRRWRIASVLASLFRERGISTVDELIARLTMSNEMALAKEVVEALLNNETYFFRDRTPFELLNKEVLPRLARQRAASRRITIWSAGCSTGQEALSLAMMFGDQEEQWKGWTIEIVGTDVSETIIDTAKGGIYSQFEIQRGLPMLQMIKWFKETPQGWVANEKLLKMIDFRLHNVLDPQTHGMSFDLILCRNVLLYFDGANRKRAFSRLAEAINPDGWLMLGAGETVIGLTDRFEPDPGLVGLYRPAAADLEARASGTSRS